MTIKFTIPKSEPVGAALKRVAGGQIKRARRVLSRKPAGSVANAVHEARTRFKKVRGVLRIARRALGRKLFMQENVFFRDAGREIRAVRDSAALIEALDGFSRRCFGKKRPAIVVKFRRLLAADAQRLARSVASGPAFSRTARQLRGELKRVKAWKLDDFALKDARRAWRRGWKLCRRAFEAARAEPADEALHEWRKRAKVLLYETLLLRNRYPELAESLREIETLTNLLGEYRDLALLGKEALDRREVLGFPKELKALLALVAARREELRAEAFALASGWSLEKCGRIAQKK